MAISKLAIISLVGIASVVTVGAITAGVVVSNQKSSNNLSNDQSHEMINDHPIETIDLTTKQGLVDFANSINEKDVVIRPIKTNLMVDKNQVVIRNNSYAFNIKSAQLEYENKTLIDNQIDVELKVDVTKNSIASLNDGNLVIGLKLAKRNNSELSVEVNKTLKGFKTGSETLKNIVFTKQDNEAGVNEKDYSLVLNPKMDDSVNKYTSIEQLNKISEVQNGQTKTKVSGLSTWLNNSTLGMGNVKDITVVGEVKLESISLENEKANFTLVTKDINNPVKLVTKKQDSDEIEELAISSIKTTNLIASSLKVVAEEINENNTKKLVTGLNALNNGNSYKKDEKENLQFDPEGSSSTNLVTLTPFSLQTTTQKPISELSLSIEVSFGNKTYSTKEIENWKELKAAGFNFQLLTKMLLGNMEFPIPSDIRQVNNKLSTYLKSENYNTPVALSTMLNQKATEGMYYVSSLDMSNETGVVKVKLADLKMQEKEEGTKPINFISLANYTYKGIENNKGFYSSYLSLIQIPKTTQAS